VRGSQLLPSRKLFATSKKKDLLNGKTFTCPLDGTPRTFMNDGTDSLKVVLPSYFPSLLIDGEDPVKAGPLLCVRFTPSRRNIDAIEDAAEGNSIFIDFTAGCVSKTAVWE
jgi:hypothetical protein